MIFWEVWSTVLFVRGLAGGGFLFHRRFFLFGGGFFRRLLFGRGFFLSRLRRGFFLGGLGVHGTRGANINVANGGAKPPWSPVYRLGSFDLGAFSPVEYRWFYKRSTITPRLTQTQCRIKPPFSH